MAFGEGSPEYQAQREQLGRDFIATINSALDGGFVSAPVGDGTELSLARPFEADDDYRAAFYVKYDRENGGYDQMSTDYVLDPTGAWQKQIFADSYRHGQISPFISRMLDLWSMGASTEELETQNPTEEEHAQSQRSRNENARRILDIVGAAGEEDDLGLNELDNGEIADMLKRVKEVLGVE
jgi:hypothetical protein